MRQCWFGLSMRRELNSIGFRLYESFRHESFRPDVPHGNEDCAED